MTASKTAALAGATLALSTLAAAPGSARAQDALDGPWLALAGCWVETGAPAGAPMTCVIPEGNGAAFMTVGRDGVVDRQRIRADGVERTLDAAGCAGVQSAELSRTGERVYTRARLGCDGGTERATRGLIAMVSPEEWVQVRALTVGQESVSWVTRYRPASAARVDAAGVEEVTAAVRDRQTAIETARMALAAAPSVDDVIEAHRRTEPEAVRAWIAEHRTPLRLDAQGLVRMADAGVSESVIDVVVAVSYPERFEVGREPQRRTALDERDRYGYDGYRDSWRYRGPFFYDPFYYGYAPYSPYGYSSWGHGYGSPTVVVVRPVDELGGTGRAVNGRGYTRGDGDATSGSLRPRSGSDSSVRAGSGYTGSRGSASSGSSSSSSGKAKPRGGGGG